MKHHGQHLEWQPVRNLHVGSFGVIKNQNRTIPLCRNSTSCTSLLVMTPEHQNRTAPFHFVRQTLNLKSFKGVFQVHRKDILATKTEALQCIGRHQSTTKDLAWCYFWVHQTRPDLLGLSQLEPACTSCDQPTWKWVVKLYSIDMLWPGFWLPTFVDRMNPFNSMWTPTNKHWVSHVKMCGQNCNNPSYTNVTPCCYMWDWMG